MYRMICNFSMAALLGAAVPLAAQSPTSTTPPPPGATQTSEAIKLTGCVREAPGTPASGAPAEKNAAAKFSLEVMTPHASTPSSSVSPETTPPQAAGATQNHGKETYTLMAMGGVDLTKHVDHLVEVTGSKAGTAATTGMAATASERPMFHVTALRMVAASCTQTAQ